MLTKGAVDDLHATAIGETLYVVGPHKGFAIEADAYNYHVEEIKELYVKSNYPEFLWDVCSSDQRAGINEQSLVFRHSMLLGLRTGAYLCKRYL